MAEQIVELKRLLNKLQIDEIMQDLRKSFYENIELKRKTNSEFSRRLEHEERNFFDIMLAKEANSNLKYRLNLYNSLDNLNYYINELKNIFK